MGGLYGVNLGRMFFGESMFAWQTDASKIALAALVCFCKEHGIDLIDCQQETQHLASLGARPWPRVPIRDPFGGRSISIHPEIGPMIQPSGATC